MICKTPEAKVGQVAVSVANNDQDYVVNRGSSFEYKESTYIVTVSPSAAPVRGGTRVEVTGVNLNNDQVRCRFGPTYAFAAVVSSSKLHCITAAHPTGTSAVHVMSRGTLLVIKEASFAFGLPSVVEDISPSSVSWAGSHVLTITGHEFQNTEQMVCRFAGRTLTTATWRSASQILCNPGFLGLGNVTVEVADNGFDFGTAFVTLEVVASPTILSVVPSIGWSTGGTQVVVLGTNFVTPAVACLFGDVEIECERISRVMLKCIAPAHVVGKVSVSAMAQDSRRSFGDGPSFRYMRCDC